MKDLKLDPLVLELENMWDYTLVEMMIVSKDLLIEVSMDLKMEDLWVIHLISHLD